jgi:hypothetical protein
MKLKLFRRLSAVSSLLRFSPCLPLGLASSTSDPRLTNPPTYEPKNGFHRDKIQRPVNRASLHFDRVRRERGRDG